MNNMADTVRKIKAELPNQVILVGGAPLTDDFRKEIGADYYSPDPQGAVEYLNSIVA
jgi:methanogenic corrinoid protein MtbC1